MLRVLLGVILRGEAIQIPRRIFRRFPVLRSAWDTAAAAHPGIFGLADVVELDSTGPRSRVRHMLAKVRHETLDYSVTIVR